MLDRRISRPSQLSTVRSVCVLVPPLINTSSPIRLKLTVPLMDTLNEDITYSSDALRPCSAVVVVAFLLFQNLVVVVVVVAAAADLSTVVRIVLLLLFVAFSVHPIDISILIGS